jgi:hypothetical protein
MCVQQNLPSSALGNYFRYTNCVLHKFICLCNLATLPFKSTIHILSAKTTFDALLIVNATSTHALGQIPFVLRNMCMEALLQLFNKHSSQGSEALSNYKTFLSNYKTLIFTYRISIWCTYGQSYMYM